MVDILRGIVEPGQVRCANEADLVSRIGEDGQATRALLAVEDRYLRLPWLGLVPA